LKGTLLSEFLFIQILTKFSHIDYCGAFHLLLQPCSDGQFKSLASLYSALHLFLWRWGVFYEVIKYDATSCPKVFHVVCLGLYFQYILSDFNQPDLKACSLKGNSTYAHIQNKLV